MAEGIDSDLNNLVTLMNATKIFPDNLFLEEIVRVARKELSWEVDYIRWVRYRNVDYSCIYLLVWSDKKYFRSKWTISFTKREAAAYRYFRNILKEDPVFFVPKVFDEVSSNRVLTTEMVDGVSLEHVWKYWITDNTKIEGEEGPNH